jgi:outer membrane protein
MLVIQIIVQSITFESVSKIKFICMKNVSTILSVIALLGVIGLGIVQFSGKHQHTSDEGAPAAAAITTLKIAYVNLDSLQEHYDYWKKSQSDFQTRQQAAESELQRSLQQLQNDYAEVEKKANAQMLSKEEYEAAQKRLSQGQQSLETRRQTLTDQLAKEQETFNKSLRGRLDSFIEQYNKDKHYDYILSYIYSNSVFLHVNPQYDITNDIVKGMNATTNKK